MDQTFDIYVVNAFTQGPFTGNPAAYVPLEEWLPNSMLQDIAAQHNLSETVFTIPGAEAGHFHIRWFTPTVEVDLCGHATLAAAHVIFEQLAKPINTIHLQSKSGELSVWRNDLELTLDFPTDQISKADLSVDFKSILGSTPTEVYQGRNDLLLIFPEEQHITSMKPNFRALSDIAVRGIIVSAPSTKYDFISRGFFPASGIDEDPATGSAHTTLTPYWSNKLQKSKLTAKQCSQRGGYFTCENKGLRTLITGKCQTYMTGKIRI